MKGFDWKIGMGTKSETSHIGARFDTFAEKNGKTTKQAVIPQTGGTVKIMKQ